MARIHILSKEIYQLIAAGEVVERPSSIVKEMIENSVDAGAKNITVEIKNGGIKLIRVADNGKGIPSEQVPTAFLRHATSKLNTADDLYNISVRRFTNTGLSAAVFLCSLYAGVKSNLNNEPSKANISASDVSLNTLAFTILLPFT